MSTLQQRFDIFWDAYPKKRHKDDAERRFYQKKIDDDTLAAILAALQWQKKSKDWTKNEGQFIPYPATYLNAGGWKDVPTIAQPEPPQPIPCACGCGYDASRGPIRDGKRWRTDRCWYNSKQPKPTGPTPFRPETDPELQGNL